MDRKTYDYFSDEELDSFIAQIEAEPLRQAPDYLKGMILDKASKMEANKIVPMASAKAHTPMTRAAARRQLFDYGIKVCAGAAAAIAIMFVLPTVNNVEQGAQQQNVMEQMLPQQADMEQETDDSKDEDRGSILSGINRATSNFCSNLFDKTNEIIKGGK